MAYAAAMIGYQIRRVGWVDRWLRFYNGLWWVIPATGAPYVVTTSDFTAEDFRVTDWTHMSASCLAQIEESDPRFPACPLPYAPPTAPVPGSPSPTPRSFPAVGGQSRGPQGPPANLPETLPDSSGGGPGGGGGGGGGGPIPDPDPLPPPDILWPPLSLTATTEVECLENDGTGMASFLITGSVRLNETYDPRALTNSYWVHVKVGQKTKTFLMSVGDTQYFDVIAGPVNIGQGSISVTATAAMAHGPGTTLSAEPVIIAVPTACSFIGFNSLLNPSVPSGTYDYMAVFDWDGCLMSAGIADSFSGGGRTFISYPWPGYSFSYDVGNGTNATYEKPDNVVDGHLVFKSNRDGTATCISGTGAYAAWVGQVQSIAQIRGMVPMDLGRGDDQLLYVCGPTVQVGCCEGATADIPWAYLWND